MYVDKKSPTYDGSARLDAPGLADDADRPPRLVALVNAIERVSRALDEETAALRERQPADLDELNNRKSQGLLELSRIGREIDRAVLDPELTARLVALREKLEENRAVLKLHLQAVQEISDILVNAIRDEDSDGTYSARGRPEE